MAQLVEILPVERWPVLLVVLRWRLQQPAVAIMLIVKRNRIAEIIRTRELS